MLQDKNSAVLHAAEKGCFMAKELILTGITKTYPGVTALDDVSISFDNGEIHALIGENGAGKSTLIKVL